MCPISDRSLSLSQKKGWEPKDIVSANPLWRDSKESKWWTPNRTNLSVGRTVEPVAIYSETPPRLLRKLGSFDVTPEPGVDELDVFLLAGETIRPDPARLFRSRPPNYHNPLATREGMPGVAYRWLEVEGPIYDQWPPAGHTLLFDNLPVKKSKSGERVEVTSQNPTADAERLLRIFLPRAYRRPVAEAEVKRFLAVIHGALKKGRGLHRRDDYGLLGGAVFAGIRLPGGKAGPAR